MKISKIPRKTIRPALVLLCAMAAITVLPVSADEIKIGATTDQKKETKMLEARDLQARGKELRKAIDDVYKKLSEANAIKTMGNGRNLITDVVVKYIPIGSSFDEAETVLRVAGFNVGPRGNNPVFPNYFSATGVIDQYVPTLFGKTSISVSLEPASKSDWTVVRSITAEITKQFI